MACNPRRIRSGVGRSNFPQRHPDGSVNQGTTSVGNLIRREAFNRRQLRLGMPKVDPGAGWVIKIIAREGYVLGHSSEIRFPMGV